MLKGLPSSALATGLLSALLASAAPTSSVEPRLVGTAASAPTLGRLFTTPDEREAIDRRRKGESFPPPKTAQAVIAMRTAKPQLVTGVVTRSDGRNTVWVDGEARQATAGDANRRSIGKRVGDAR